MSTSTAACSALDLLAIAGEFNRVTPDIAANSTAIASYLTNQAKLRGLSTVQLIRRDRSVIVQGETASNRRRSAGAGGDFRRTRFGQAGADRAGNDQPRRRRDQAHRLRQRLPLSGAADRSARHTQPAADGGERRRIRAASGEQVRRAGGVRHRLRRRGAGRASLRHLDRAGFCPQPRRRRSGG